jgi:ferritin
MIGKRMQDALNAQIQHEMESSYLYLAMAAYFAAAGYEGMAHWMKIQSQEETKHALRLFDHLVDREGRVELLPLSKPKKEWPSPVAAFEEAHQHELFITGKIHDLVRLAAEEKDYAAGLLLQWYVGEQVEEEASAAKGVRLLRRVGESGQGLVLADRELGSRGA